jgi:hypothetical protein
MERTFNIENADEWANAFESQDQLYQWLYDLHQDIEIDDLSEVLKLFVNMEMHEHYLTVKRFIANEIDL